MSETEKWCPLQTKGQLSPRPVRCCGGECAMWNEYLGCCGLIAPGIALGQDIDRIQDSGDDYHLVHRIHK